MLVVGLHGWILPPGAILVCDIFVYSEFLIHPLLLLGASGKMRREVLRGVKTNVTVSLLFGSHLVVLAFYYRRPSR